MTIKELEKTLWATAKKLRNNTDAVTHMHLVLGLIFLKYITDALNELQENSIKGGVSSAAFESKDIEKSRSSDSFCLPEKAQWAFLQSNANHSQIGLFIDDAIDAIEKTNKNLKGILPGNYANLKVDKTVLGELVKLTGHIGLKKQGRDKKHLYGQIYEYLLKRFAETEGQNAGYFYTPEKIAKLVAEMLEPHKGKIYDGCCGMGEMFIQSEKFIIERHGKTGNQIFYGQDADRTVVKLAKMNLAIHGIDADLQFGDTFTNDCYSNLEADFILAHPPFTIQQPKGNQQTKDLPVNFSVGSERLSHYTWLQHFISKLSPTGTAGILLPAGSMYSKRGNDGQIRRNLIEDKLVDCMVALPSGLLYDTAISCCLWILARNKTNNRYTNADNEILFIDARKSGTTVSGRSKELTDEDILLISKTYHRWRNINGDYTDIKGFCKAVSIEEIRKNGYVLNPERYVNNRFIKKVSFALLSIIFLVLGYLFILKNGLLTTTPATGDTAIVVQSKQQNDSIQPVKKINKQAKKKDKNDNVKVKDNAAVRDGTREEEDSFLIALRNKPLEITPPVAKTSPPKTKTAPAKITASPVSKDPSLETSTSSTATSYKVISKAYFYDEPDENTRRRAFISHWNNSYANIKAIDEKNDFIYVVFTNHLNQTSRGWLRKKDLTEANQ